MERADSSKIKAVILDYGEVLCYPPTAEETGRMAALFGVEPALFQQLWDRNRLRYDRGDLSPEAYWLQLAQDAGTSIGPRQLEQLYGWDSEMWGHENPTMVEWLRQLRASGMKTGLLSNMHHNMIRYLRQNFSWLDQFDHQTYSAEVSLVKPEPAIYEHSLRGVGVAASEALFVDDKKANVEGARAVGLCAIQFHSVEQLRDELRKLGLSVLPDGAGAPSSVRAL